MHRLDGGVPDVLLAAYNFMKLALLNKYRFLDVYYLDYQTISS